MIPTARGFIVVLSNRSLFSYQTIGTYLFSILFYSYSVRRSHSLSIKLSRLLATPTSFNHPHVKTTAPYDDERYVLYKAYNAFRVLSKSRGRRTWQRLQSIVELALQSTRNNTCTSTIQHHDTHRHQSCCRQTIADIGTDHGLLAIALAATEQFQQVIGVDQSSLALKNGAYRVMERIHQFRQPQGNCSIMGNKSQYPDLPVVFRQGNGLQALNVEEADIVIIAGMGVQSMIDIMSMKAASTESSSTPSIPQLSLLETLGTKHVILQPSNSKPKLLLEICQFMHDVGWSIVDEKVVHVSHRWYFSIYFTRQQKPIQDATHPFPGYILSRRDQAATHGTLRQYVQHHLTWLKHNSGASSSYLDASNIICKYHLQTIDAMLRQ
jgi:tRNA A22 N-methylase